MLDFIFRTLGLITVILAFYAVVMLIIFRDQIRRTIELRNKYGYPWCIAWSVANTDAALEKQLRRVKQYRRQP